jgi:hypothetical protein
MSLLCVSTSTRSSSRRCIQRYTSTTNFVKQEIIRVYSYDDLAVVETCRRGVSEKLLLRVLLTVQFVG